MSQQDCFDILEAKVAAAKPKKKERAVSTTVVKQPEWQDPMQGRPVRPAVIMKTSPVIALVMNTDSLRVFR